MVRTDDEDDKAVAHELVQKATLVEIQLADLVGKRSFSCGFPGCFARFVGTKKESAYIKAIGHYENEHYYNGSFDSWESVELKTVTALVFIGSNLGVEVPPPTKIEDVTDPDSGETSKILTFKAENPLRISKETEVTVAFFRATGPGKYFDRVHTTFDHLDDGEALTERNKYLLASFGDGHDNALHGFQVRLPAAKRCQQCNEETSSGMCGCRCR